MFLTKEAPNEEAHGNFAPAGLRPSSFTGRVSKRNLFSERQTCTQGDSLGSPETSERCSGHPYDADRMSVRKDKR